MIFPGILNPVDEFEYWSDLARVGKGDARERAEHFCELFKPISKDYGGLDAMSLQDAMEMVDITQDTLDDVWRQTEFDAYPESRMKNLMEAIGKNFVLGPGTYFNNLNTAPLLINILTRVS